MYKYVLISFADEYCIKYFIISLGHNSRTKHYVTK